MNVYGEAVKDAFATYASFPLSDADFEANLASVLTDVESGDADGDGVSNLDEILAGSQPGFESSVPGAPMCPTAEQLEGLEYKLCQYDPVYAYRKVATDFCGLGPTYDEVEAFRVMAAADQAQAIHDKLDHCIDTQFWLGPNGVLWEIAHRKIRPVQGLINFADFNPDYDYFVWTQIDGHDARDVLVGQYLVVREDVGEPPNVSSFYSTVDDRPEIPMQQDKRAGMLTMAWPLFYNTMFTALPRGTAAAAYRAFLDLDIAASEGLSWPITAEPVDYDNAGVTAPDCAACHSTLDPLSYPFSRYNGLQGDSESGIYQYDANRINKYFVNQYPEMANMPEQGYIFGQPVNDLRQWAQVAANSDAFYQATVNDYWRTLFGTEPDSADVEMFADYTATWQSLRDDSEHSVERMLHTLIETEAYGAP